jgi:hypothetical protein
VFNSPNPTYPFLSERDFSLAGLQEWNLAARSVPKDNPFFRTLEGLLDTEEEGMWALYVTIHTGDPFRPLQSPPGGRGIAWEDQRCEGGSEALRK